MSYGSSYPFSVEPRRIPEVASAGDDHRLVAFTNRKIPVSDTGDQFSNSGWNSTSICIGLHGHVVLLVFYEYVKQKR